MHKNNLTLIMMYTIHTYIYIYITAYNSEIGDRTENLVFF